MESIIIDKEISKIEKLNSTHPNQDHEKIAIEIIEKLFDNKVKVFFSKLDCIIVVLDNDKRYPDSGKCLFEQVGSPTYGLMGFLVGEQQTASLRDLAYRVDEFLDKQDKGEIDYPQ